MSNEEINKYLTEAMGDSECESMPKHVYVSYGRSAPWNKETKRFCKYCGNLHPDYFTWEGFGKLWEWATKQEWWEDDFLRGAIQFLGCNEYKKFTSQNLINPTTFANAIYEYLKEKP